ncbi:hypothetical protein D3C80_1406440 [compost metagenome]
MTIHHRFNTQADDVLLAIAALTQFVFDGTKIRKGQFDQLVHVAVIVTMLTEVFSITAPKVQDEIIPNIDTVRLRLDVTDGLVHDEIPDPFSFTRVA